MRNRKTLFIALTLLISNFQIFSQSYFQQEVNYKIDVELNDKNHSLRATEEIEYINNSPDALEFIYFHLWPNAYKNGETALAHQKGKLNKWYENENMTGYIDSIDFRINGQTAKWEYDKEHIDICKLQLNNPLKPGEKIIITTPFYVKIPHSSISRLGHGGQSYQITQWYPKPAVYDKYGWHQFPYLNMGEFYSEFGSFDVKITLPKNYVVGATGDLQNPEELIWLNELAKQTSEIKDFDNKKDYSFPPSDSVLKTIHYKQSNVHDFAWFADKRFNVLKSIRKMPHTGKEVTCWAMFLNKEAHLWQRSLEYIGDALYYYSLWYDDYPYNHATAVHSSISAGGGMEYPNITVIGDSRTDMSLEMVIMHEVGHNWFYGILGFNEREFPWQDEGINSFSEARYMETKYKGNDKLYPMFLKEKYAKLLNIEELPYKTFHRYSYLMTARFNIDQPASLHSEQFTSTNYGQIVYHKTSCIFSHLHFYLGEDQFNTIMQNFYNEWKFKHPYPEDIRKAFEKESGRDLSWLFDDLLSTSKKLDYKITGLRKNQLSIKNTGDIDAPFPVFGIKNDSVVFTQWYNFSGKKTIKLPENKDFDYIKIDPEYDMPEMYTNNNYIRKKGLFRKIEPLHFQLAGIVENTDKSNIYLFPAMGWNQYNNYMLGLLFYNSFIPRDKFEYQIMPMYGFGNHNLAGYFNLEYHILPYESIFREVTVGLSGKRYAYSSASDDNFEKIKAEINFHLNRKNPKSKIYNNIILGATLATDITPLLMDRNPKSLSAYYFDFDFIHKNKALNPYSVNISAQYYTRFFKTSTEFNYQWKYMRNKSAEIRLFAGAFLNSDKSFEPVYNFGLSGNSGSADYTYDNMFLGRFEDPSGTNLWGKQYVANDGGFTIYAPQFTTSKWLAAINTSIAIPYLPRVLNFHIYGNIATFGTPDDYLTYKNSDRFAWECGIQYRIANKAVVISMPLLMSAQLREFSDDVYNNYFERIRFSIDLSALNVFDIFEKSLP